ncbi:hypothetical protein JCGZ_01616 [Jatropha curcas]|uniref:Disease resistance protein RPS4B/Roq1-like leucine-rich repeats domain-containing protein n=1 Tax=Jatropha curcas TaxID=180498 RepID=A0A067L1L0_JATCU|nr:hypothetical protein JCGZ_01616 [Jatropha curcas]
MGKEIVNEECKQPGGRSRLWNPEDISHGTDKIECISFRMSSDGAIEINSKNFMKMPNLRFLRITRSKWILPDDLDFFPEELRYLCWYGYPLKSLPLKFCPNNLVQLLLPESQLKQLWDGDNKKIKSNILRLENLKTLDLQGCSKLEECPEIPCNLRYLYLSETAIKQLPSSIGHCSQLVVLWLHGCTKLENLPDCIGQLQSLELIDVTDLKFSTLPNNFGYLKSLKKLDATGSGIKTLPSSFNQLSRLERLKFMGCNGLTVWPSLSGLNSLQRLFLGNCGISEIPESIGSLVSLKGLYLDRNDFKSIPASIKQLSNLDTLMLNDCKRLRYLPELPGTRSFSASNCTSLEFVSFSSFSKAETEDDLLWTLFSEDDLPGTRLNFSNCIKLGDNIRLQITEALFSAQQGRDVRFRSLILN